MEEVIVKRIFVSVGYQKIGIMEEKEEFEKETSETTSFYKLEE